MVFTYVYYVFPSKSNSTWPSYIFLRTGVSSENIQTDQNVLLFAFLRRKHMKDK